MFDFCYLGEGVSALVFGFFKCTSIWLWNGNCSLSRCHILDTRSVQWVGVCVDVIRGWWPFIVLMTHLINDLIRWGIGFLVFLMKKFYCRQYSRYDYGKLIKLQSWTGINKMTLLNIELKSIIQFHCRNQLTCEAWPPNSPRMDYQHY